MGGLNVEKGLAGLALGAVAGYGRGLQASGQAKREMMIKRLEAGDRFMLEDRRHRNRLTEIREGSKLTAQREREKFTREAGRKPKGMFKDLAPLLREAREYATATDEDGFERLDESRYNSFLRSAGLGKMADTLTMQAKTGRGPFDPRLFEEAGERAAAEADDKAGWLSTDETDFADYGGSRERFKTARQQEIYESFGGRGQPPGPEPGGGKGQKTQAVNFDGLSKAEARRRFDAMKNGARFIRDGVEYEKVPGGARRIQREF